MRGARQGWLIYTYCPPAWCLYVGVHPGRREGSLPPPSGGRTDPDCCLCLWSKQQLRVSTLFGLLGGGARKCSSADSLVLLGDFKEGVFQL